MNSIDLQKKMIIQKSYDSMSMIRLRDILLVLATWFARLQFNGKQDGGSAFDLT